jgi:hypothetical protein
MATAQSSNDPLCAFCGKEVRVMEAIIFHGVVYHPACVEPTTGRGRRGQP